MTDKDISGKTKICGLIGDPIEHTMSPAMHNAAYKELGLDYIYLPFRVKPEQLAQAVEGLRALNVRGFNVTIPHKVSVIPLLDGLDRLAEKIGAVNTVVNNDGELRGYNTGGASRAITYVLAEKGACLTVLNRQLELDWAEDIAELIYDDLGVEVKVMELGHLPEALEGADILVNATSVGMSPTSEESPVSARLVTPGLVVFDIVYNPMMTRLLREAKAAGARTIGGVDMLAWQGALAFEKWTGQAAPVELMREEAIKMLEKEAT
jgi:shikimate dehydrogenase